MMSHPMSGGKASPLAGQSILHPRAARLTKQSDTRTKRERLTKLFEFLKAYTDLRYRRSGEGVCPAD
jgi:hypothetical protein